MNENRLIEEDLIAYAKPFLKQQGFKKKNKRWTKVEEEFTLVFWIQGSSWDKGEYYVRPGIFINGLEPPAFVEGHLSTEIDRQTPEQVMRDSMRFFNKWTDKSFFRERLEAFMEWEKRNPLEKRRANEVDYEKDPVPAEELFELSESAKKYILKHF